MRLPFGASFRALLRPGEAFAPAPPSLASALWQMSRVWMPLALLNALGTTWGASHAYAALRQGAVSADLLGWFGVDPADLRESLAALPPAPAFGRIWPWLLLAVPLGVLGTWLHHAVWDHLGLWLLGGLKKQRGFRASLLAEAQALRVAALGTLVGLLGFIPVLGALLALPLLLLDAYLWMFRGFALAARHECEPWRGLAATVLHAVMVGGCALGLLGLTLFLVRMAA